MNPLKSIVRSSVATVAFNVAITIAGLLLLSSCGGQQFAVEGGSAEFGQQVTYSKEVDVLWVVDTSSSMAKHQTLLANQVPVFIDALNSTGLDYHIGVTTMDMSGSGNRGNLLAQSGTPLYLTRDTPNLVGLLKGRLQAGENGSSVERGREATLAALNSAGPGGANAGFLRENSLLNLIFLTDEEDQSSSAVDYLRELDTLRPPLPYGDRSWVAHFMGVMPDDPSCKTSEWGFSSPGTRYIELAGASGGTTETICDANFLRALTNVKARVLEVVTEYPLDRKPIESSIKVVVNGVEVLKGSENGWTYRPTANSIRFHGSAIPAAGARIQVTFDPEGLK